MQRELGSKQFTCSAVNTLYREITAVCSEIHTKQINTLCGQNVELLNVKLAVHIVITGFIIGKFTFTKP